MVAVAMALPVVEGHLRSFLSGRIRTSSRRLDHVFIAHGNATAMVERWCHSCTDVAAHVPRLRLVLLAY